MKAPIESKSIGLCIVLSIITIGIYAFYWLYHIQEDVYALIEKETPVSGGILILLSIVTFGIYLIYWWYITGQALDEYIVNNEGGVNGSRNILYLVLSIIGLGIVNMALIQNDLNQRANVVV